MRHFPQVFLSRFTRLLDNTDIHLRLRSTLTRIYRHILDRNTQFIALISLSPLPSPGRCYFQSLKKFVRLENSFPPSFLSFLLFFLPSFFPFFFFQFTLGPIVPDRETRSGPGGEGRREGAVTIEKSRKFRANLIYRRSHLRFATQLSFHPLTRRPRCREGIRGGQGWDPLDPCSFFRARIYYWFHRRHAGGTAGWIRLIKNTLDSPLPLPPPFHSSWLSPRWESSREKLKDLLSNLPRVSSSPFDYYLSLFSDSSFVLPVKFLSPTPVFLADNSIEIFKYRFPSFFSSIFSFTRFPTTRRDKSRKVKRRETRPFFEGCSRFESPLSEEWKEARRRRRWILADSE